ncbi:MAG: membrane protein insertase YidC [Chloroflexi bacterium]|nr:membrane protein insertase YidC [Chloroflexota bacterium]
MEIWDLIIYRPILNFLILLSSILFSNFGLAIIALTIIVRAVMTPLILKQLRSSKKMADAMRTVQPKIQQLKKKYAKDPRKLQQEQMKLYKEAGISPMGCLSSPMLVSTLIQIPIFIALYRGIIQAMAVTPQDFLGLSDSLYSWSMVREALPVSGSFLWLNLAKTDPYFLMPILVGATMWVSQKMISQPAADPQQQSMQNMMQIMMPLMFGFITLTLPSGVGLYFLVTTLASIPVQYHVYGWGNLRRQPAAQAPSKKAAKPEKQKLVEAPVVADTPVAEQVANPKEGARHGKSGIKRKDRRRSH